MHFDGMLAEQVFEWWVDGRMGGGNQSIDFRWHGPQKL